jgi:hypothetical protein
MNSFKQRLLTGWSLMRVLRMAFGLIFAVQAVMMKDALVGLMSAFFLHQGVTNTGCCGESCSPINDISHRKSDTVDITFEEVK